MATEVKKGISRRDYVKIAGGTAAFIGLTLAESCSGATSPTQSQTQTTPPPTTQATIPAASEVYQFFNAVEAATIQAAFGQLIPGTTADPGAVQAQADVYIDHALMGAYANLQQTYKRGIVAMNAYSQAQFSNTFASLTSTQQISVLTDMQNGAAATATYFYFPTATQFFSLLLTHVNEGMFCDPVYGGNQNLVGWKLLGYPGSQTTYNPSQMAIGFDQATIPAWTLANVEAETMPLPTSGY